ncbi:hypothetical protein MNEG_15833 [Monoraphidium neglectum]|uniref:Jacalin-type lectin domain-containing protein n=1 Tax=Monoraphidium neglectum TaxID=145388 RepID=A0A0D2M9U5_9CHLO|nr:hypothetical protein MNEG_15833 [Monoraphidium neglectum]KIY92130.1 hypothetical protein MNEG_15833 [Monoraphidium neglectum]|eukprot:XP_013891150.1 hypothetical protein MNEG_15833 [Monoraphidium neglectum]
MPTYGYTADGAQLLGRETGRGQTLAIYPASGEFLTKIEAAGTGCVEYLKISTNGVRSVQVGKPVAKAVSFTAPGGLELFALKGFYGAGCAGPAVQFIWGTEKCEEKKVVAAVPLPAAPSPVPTPVPVPVPTPVPVPVPTPVPVLVPSPVALPVPTPSPVPVPVRTVH